MWWIQKSDWVVRTKDHGILMVASKTRYIYTVRSGDGSEVHPWADTSSLAGLLDAANDYSTRDRRLYRVSRPFHSIGRHNYHVISKNTWPSNGSSACNKT